MAEERARNSLPEGIFDSLPDIVKQTMIQKELEHEEERKRLQQEAIEHQKQIEMMREGYQESLERKAYQEQKARELARDREMLRRSGIAERIGASLPSGPYKLNRTEVDHMDISCEFPINEQHPQELIPGVLMGFRRETIEALVPQMEEIMNRAHAHQDVQRSATGYIMFHLWTGGMRRAGTRAISVSNGVEEAMPKLWEALDNLINDINKVKAGYSYLFEGETSYMHFRFKANYYPNPKNVSNWGHNIKPIERRQYFNIFTASDGDINCVKQCGQRLFGESFDSVNIDDIIQWANKINKPVCIVKPHSSITNLHDIMEYKDLVIEANSPVKSLAVIDPDTIYLLHFDEHLGILEETREPKKHIHYTQFRPINKYPKCHKVTMMFDIECYFDPDNNTRHIPYLACACFIYSEEGKPDRPGNVLEFTGKDCVAQMIEYAADNVAELGVDKIELVAHNGGAYDFHYLLTSMYDPSIIKNLTIRNNKFIGFNFKYQNVTFYVKDSFNFLICSLSRAAKSFLDEHDGKTDFPHHEVRSEEDLQRTFNKWMNVEHNVNVNVEKEKMIVTSEHKINYDKDENAKKLIDWAREYCCNDVIVLAKVWIKFKAIVKEIFGCEIVDQTMTLAGMSFRLFEAHLPTYMEGKSQNVKLYNTSKKDFTNMREALIGGRCISLNGIYGDVTGLDVKSLYPAAMAYYDQPYGQERKVTEEVENELGIYYCHVEPVVVKGHGFFPLKRDGDVTYKNASLEPYNAWYTSVDMEIGRQEGHQITAIPYEKDTPFVGYSWKHKGKIFKEYIEGILYKLKLMYEQEKRSEHRQVIKIIMNSLWGKFAQKWMDTSYSIKAEEDCDMERDECHAIFDTNYFLVKGTNDKQVSSKPVQNGVFTLSWARYHMFQLWHKCTIPGAPCIYSDTDSMFVESKYLVKDNKFILNGKEIPVIGKDMGQLEVECVFDELICVGKKQYIGKYNGNQYKKRFKGVPLEYVKPELYAHLIKDPNNTAQIKFLKFKREYGCVHGYNEVKVVKQTF